MARMPSRLRRSAVLAVAGCTILAAAAAVADPPSPVPAGRVPGANKPMIQPVPFKLAKPDKPLILVETTVNGSGPFRFVLDTGAGLTMVSPRLAKKLGIEKNESEKAIGAGGSVDVHFGTVDSIAVGRTRLEGLKVGIMDLTGIGQAIETDIDGIIGYNFMTKFRVTIDYPGNTIVFE